MTWSGGPTQFSGTSINDVRVPANVYSGNFASGALLNFATVNPTYGGIYLTDGSGVKNVDYLRFNSSPANIAMTLTFTMADGTTKSVTFTPQTHAGCLSINMFPAKLGSGNARVQDWTVTNNCGYAVTWVNSTGSTWTGTRNLNSIYVNGSPVWTASVPSGGAIVLSPAYTINAGAVATMDWRYSGTMLNQQVYFKFNMNDGSQASSEFTQKSCLAINTASAAISGAGFTELQGITVRNQCTARSLTWSTVVVTWTVPPNNMTAMTVNAVSVWTGSAIPGATVNHTDVAFTASQQKPINFFRFNGDARTKTFTIRFNMIDGSYYTTPSFSPP
jgi:hypothetical protein